MCLCVSKFVCEVLSVYVVCVVVCVCVWSTSLNKNPYTDKIKIRRNFCLWLPGGQSLSDSDYTIKGEILLQGKE